jgi:UDPglucose 6-dehydrogenase
MLRTKGARVVAHDPMADAAAACALDGLGRLDTLANCLRDADVVIVATPDPAYAALDGHAFATGNKRVTVVDCWRILERKLQAVPQVRYVPVGRGRLTNTNEIDR